MPARRAGAGLCLSPARANRCRAGEILCFGTARDHQEQLALRSEPTRYSSLLRDSSVRCSDWCQWTYSHVGGETARHGTHYDIRCNICRHTTSSLTMALDGRSGSLTSGSTHTTIVKTCDLRGVSLLSKSVGRNCTHCGPNAWKGR